jgi:Ca-activated chloride channel homolog
MRVFESALLISLVGASTALVGPLAMIDDATPPVVVDRQAERAGLVTGTVVDGQGAAQAGVTVELLRDRSGVVQTATTNARGEFRFDRVQRGLYEVRATRAGLAPASVRIAVNASPTPALRLTVGILMRPGTPAEIVAAQKAQESAARTRTAVTVDAATAMPAPLVPGGLAAAAAPRPDPGASPFNTEAYDKIDDNRFRRVADAPLSTFSIDVDTASYTNVRRFLNEGRLPPPDAVRIEELINYFRFAYPDARADAPFSVTTEVAACPWNPRHKLALVGLQARRHEQQQTPPRNLVFLLDVSGSMMPPDKLPLVKAAMRMLVNTLTARDRVAIVVYAGASGLVLPSTPGDRRAAILEAIDRLEAGGSTNGAAGIQLAYDTAASAFRSGGVNRVILATDGDFNVGITSQGDLIRLIERERERGIFLSVLGVGTGNLKDSTMEKLADKGNGNYAYLDSLQEARRVLVEEAGATLVTVAKDVKIQIEFNPRTVGAYRLIGYENRLLNREDFNDDRTDAGEMGAGHTVTALYELVPPGETIPGATVDPLVYQDAPKPSVSTRSGELMAIKLRYKRPDADKSRLLSVAVRDESRGLTPNIGFAAAVAQFGMLLRNSEFSGQATWTSAGELARKYRGDDPNGYRADFIRLLDLAAALAATDTSVPEAARRQPR